MWEEAQEILLSGCIPEVESSIGDPPQSIEILQLEAEQSNLHIEQPNLIRLAKF